MALTARQRKFIEVYEGNGADAARKAGYSGSVQSLSVQAGRLLKNVEIRAEIDKRNTKASKARIMSREQRQEFWSSVAADSGEEMPQRLKASELLGKSEADFVDRHEHSGALNIYLTPLPDGDEK